MNKSFYDPSKAQIERNDDKFLGSKSEVELEVQSNSSHESDAALPPSKKSPAGELGPEALLNNSTVASPNQEIRSPASADAAKTSKAQAPKDPISQSLSDSSPANNAPGPDRRSVPVLAGEVSTSSVKPGAVPPIKETNPESSRQNADRGGQPLPSRSDSPVNDSRETSGPKLLDKSLAAGPLPNKAENQERASLPGTPQASPSEPSRTILSDKCDKRMTDTEQADSAVRKAGALDAGAGVPSRDRSAFQSEQSKFVDRESSGINGSANLVPRNDLQKQRVDFSSEKLPTLEKLENKDFGSKGNSVTEGPISKALRTELSGDAKRLESNNDMLLTKETNRFLDQASPKNDKFQPSASPSVRLELPKEMRGADGPLGLIMENTKGLQSFVRNFCESSNPAESRLGSKSETAVAPPRILGFTVFSDPSQTLKDWKVKLGLSPDSSRTTASEPGLKTPNQSKGERSSGVSKPPLPGFFDSSIGQNPSDSKAVNGKSHQASQFDNFIDRINKPLGQPADKAASDQSLLQSKGKNGLAEGNQIGDRPSESNASSKPVTRQFAVKAVEILVNRLEQLGEFGSRVLLFLNGNKDSSRVPKDAGSNPKETQTSGKLPLKPFQGSSPVSNSVSNPFSNPGATPVESTQPSTKPPTINNPNSPAGEKAPNSRPENVASPTSSATKPESANKPEPTAKPGPASKPQDKVSPDRDMGEKTVIVQDLVRELLDGLTIKSKPEIKLHLPDGTYGGEIVDISHRVAPVVENVLQEGETVALQPLSGDTSSEMNPPSSLSNAELNSDSLDQAETVTQAHLQPNAAEPDNSYLTREGDTVDSVARQILFDLSIAGLLLKLNANHLLAPNSRQFKPGVYIQLPTPTQVTKFREGLL